jgi:hypothetical protein
MDFPLPTSFLENSSGSSVDGLIRLATQQDLTLWTQWRYRTSDEDRTWDWRGIYSGCADSRGQYECYAAFAMNDLQGLAVLDLAPKQTEEGYAITIDYLATNPMNRQHDHGLNHVGTALMAAAVARSIKCGTRGSVWLESLPRATHFYESIGMAKQDEVSEEGHMIYVLRPSKAEQFLRRMRAAGVVRL